MSNYKSGFQPLSSNTSEAYTGMAHQPLPSNTSKAYLGKAHIQCKCRSGCTKKSCTCLKKGRFCSSHCMCSGCLNQVSESDPYRLPTSVAADDTAPCAWVAIALCYRRLVQTTAHHTLVRFVAVQSTEFATLQDSIQMFSTSIRTLIARSMKSARPTASMRG